MIKAIDLGFGQVKAISETKQIEFPSAIGTFRPVKFTSRMEQQEAFRYDIAEVDFNCLS